MRLLLNRKLLFVMLITITSLSSKSQEVECGNEVNSIYKDIINYLIKVGELEKSPNIIYDQNQVTIVEVVSKKKLC